MTRLQAKDWVSSRLRFGCPSKILRADCGEMGGPGTGQSMKSKAPAGGGTGRGEGLLEAAGDSLERLTDCLDMTAGA